MKLIIPHFYIGVDLGQKHDFTAIAVVEYRPANLPHWLNPWDVPKETFRLRHLERVPLGTPYPKVVESVAALTRKPELEGRCTVVVDGTGVGWPVVEMLKGSSRLECPVVAVTITGGERAQRHKDGWNLPKQDLLATLMMMLEEGELEIAAKLPERRRLVEEMMAMQSGRTRRGRSVYGARGPAHDDLVLALAMACWRARQPSVGLQDTGRLL